MYVLCGMFYSPSSSLCQNVTGDKEEKRKSGLKVTKRIDISQMACAEKLEHFQSVLQARDLAEVTMYDTAFGSFGFVSR